MMISHLPAANTTSARAVVISLAVAIALLCCTPPKPAWAARPSVSASHYVLMDALTGQVLLESASTSKAYPASTTKILTSYVVLSKTGLQNMLTVPKEAKVGGSHIFLAPGNSISLEDTLFGLMLSSANDAAVTLAHAVSGSVPAFADEMNAAAKALGAVNSNFTNPHGLPENNHYTTALDLALITRAALENPAFARLVATQTREICITAGGDRRETLTNHNRMLWWYEGCTGVKTGFTQQAKHCIVAAAKRGDRQFIAVALGSYSSTTMWRDAASLLDYGFAASESREVLQKDQPVFEGSIQKGKRNLVGIAAKSFFILDYGSYPQVTVTAVPSPDLKAPLRAGQKVGVVTISQLSHVIAEVDMIAQDSVARAYPFGLSPQALALPEALALAMLALSLNRRAQRRAGVRTRPTTRPLRPRRYQRDRHGRRL